MGTFCGTRPSAGLARRQRTRPSRDLARARPWRRGEAGLSSTTMLALSTSLLRSTLPISRRTIVSVAESGPNPQAGATARARGWNQREKVRGVGVFAHTRPRRTSTLSSTSARSSSSVRCTKVLSDAVREHLKQQEELVDKVRRDTGLG